jgi:hypothetical protein
VVVSCEFGKKPKRVAFPKKTYLRSDTMEPSLSMEEMRELSKKKFEYANDLIGENR